MSKERVKGPKSDLTIYCIWFFIIMIPINLYFACITLSMVTQEGYDCMSEDGLKAEFVMRDYKSFFIFLFITFLINILIRRLAHRSYGRRTQYIYLNLLSIAVFITTIIFNVWYIMQLFDVYGYHGMNILSIIRQR